MLTFEVYKDGSHLAQWPGYVYSPAFCIFLADADDRPRERAFQHDYGRLMCYCEPGERRKLFIRHPVKGFGDPILRTRLLQAGETLRNLSVELALGRMEFMDEQQAGAAREGRTTAPHLREKIEQARRLSAEAATKDASGQRAEAAAMAEDALAISVSAGEELSIELARARLAERRAAGKLRGFLLGCGAMGNLDPAGKRWRHFCRAFNYATVGFYLGHMESPAGRVDHGPLLARCRALRERGIQVKGHPLVWAYSLCLPPRLQGADFRTFHDAFRDRIARDVPPFRGLIGYWDVINEAHQPPWTNSLGFTLQQNVVLTGMAADATRRIDPAARIVVNVCLPFGEYVAGAPGRFTPLEYLQACIDAGVDFDVIGIQFYYGSGQAQYCWDMLEVSRILDAYCSMGKAVHITELGTPSAMGPDPNAATDSGNEIGLWHGQWDESTQADWVEQFYTICMSKPPTEAITWWSFSEAERVFWPHGGLLNGSDDPKEAFRRILSLRAMIDRS